MALKIKIVQFLLLVSLLFYFTSNSIAKEASFRPKALLLPVTKDSKTLQYITQIHQRTPLVPVKVTVDLGGQVLWVNCEEGYVSSSYLPVHCKTQLCNQAKPNGCITSCFSKPGPGCNNNSCPVYPHNPVIRTTTPGQFSHDIATMHSTDGMNPGRVVTIPKLPFTCGYTSLLDGLAEGVKGMAGFGRTKISLPYLLSSTFSFPKKFATCLSGSTRGKGVIFFGDGPYVMLPNVDVSKNLIYTPLILMYPKWSEFVKDPSPEYYIGVKSIRINEKPVKLNSTLLSITRAGYGGTKISTVHPYTMLETSIYHAVVNAFVNALSQVPRVKPIAPFAVCYNATSIGSTRVGAAVPSIDLVLQNSNVYWRIFGANSMVQVNDEVLCLGFVDGGPFGSPERASIVIGGLQLEDNLLQFDLARSRLGFSSSLFFSRTTCANFNFTSTYH